MKMKTIIPLFEDYIAAQALVNYVLTSKDIAAAIINAAETYWESEDTSLIDLVNDEIASNTVEWESTYEIFNHYITIAMEDIPSFYMNNPDYSKLLNYDKTNLDINKLYTALSDIALKYTQEWDSLLKMIVKDKSLNDKLEKIYNEKYAKYIVQR